MIIKAILMIALALALALAITLTIHITSPQAKPLEGSTSMEPVVNLVNMRTSRFLAEDPKARNPRAADHCHKDGEVCAATNTHCCNNKCVDLHNDSQNCGACKNKCKFTESCCGGQCVKLSFDKRHCGSCGNKCFKGQYCIYGMCDYA